MVRIVILNKGFIAVGVYEKQGDEWCSLTHAAIIRRWGTTRGLGEIAEGGPTPETILDKTPTQHFPVHAVITTIECDRAKWATALVLEP